jgi:hypothetical protein
MQSSTNTTKDQGDVKKQSINKGIELMLPRSRREIPKSNIDLDVTLPLILWRVRLRLKLDITRGA